MWDLVHTYGCWPAETTDLAAYPADTRAADFKANKSVALWGLPGTSYDDLVGAGNVRSTEAPRHLELLLVAVDRDDHLGALQHGTLDGVEADGANADDSDRRPGRHLREPGSSRLTRSCWRRARTGSSSRSRAPR